VTWLLVMVLEISVAMAVGFVLGRIWQIRCDLEQERTGDFTPPPIARIPVSCATMAGGRIYYPRPCLEQKHTVALLEIEAAPGLHPAKTSSLRTTRRFPPPWSVDHSPSARRRCSSRISSAMIVREAA
jgi:hypothetical protein